MFLNKKDEAINFSDFIRFIKSNTSREDLISIHNELGLEIAERANVVYEMLPGMIFSFYS